MDSAPFIIPAGGVSQIRTLIDERNSFSHPSVAALQEELGTLQARVNELAANQDLASRCDWLTRTAQDTNEGNQRRLEELTSEFHSRPVGGSPRPCGRGEGTCAGSARRVPTTRVAVDTGEKALQAGVEGELRSPSQLVVRRLDVGVGRSHVAIAEGSRDHRLGSAVHLRDDPPEFEHRQGHAATDVEEARRGRRSVDDAAKALATSSM